MNAAAIDPGTVMGRFTYDGKVYALRHVYAWQPPAQVEELWVYLTDSELPAAAAQDRLKPVELAGENRFRGVKLIVNPAQPNLTSLLGVFYLPGVGGSGLAPTFNVSGSLPRWQRLLVGDKRVVGKLRYADEARERGTGWSLDVEFSAPVFGAGGKLQTLSGAQARKSPQAEAFLAYEKALLWQGLDAASVYMTSEKRADTRSTIEQFGADGFKEFQTNKRETTLQGEARRRQIEKVVVGGNNAVLEARSEPNNVEVVRLVKTKDSWKIAK